MKCKASKWAKILGKRGFPHYARKNSLNDSNIIIVKNNFYINCWEVLYKEAPSDISFKIKEVGSLERAILWADIYLSKQGYDIDRPFYISY